MSESKYLRYGDLIHLISDDGGRYYLAARSIYEENIYFIEFPYSKFGQNSTFYPLQCELIFAVYPKLIYEAFKEYSRIKPQDPKGKVDLLKRRLDVEIDNNEKRIKNFTGTPVTFGSEIQLYHLASKCFVRVTREKNSNMHFSSLYNLKLSKTGGSGVYFKVFPYYSFKKEGEKMTISDRFYLENTKLNAWMEYKQLPLITYPENPILKKLVNEPNTEYVPIFELSKLFNKYEAGLKVHDPNSSLVASVVLPSNNTNHSKIILWGDYVRIKHMTKANKQTGYLFSDHTLIGLSPKVFFRTVNGPFSYEKDSFQAIFQIVPGDENEYGTPIKFDNRNIVMRLRHLLTGRYLQIETPGKICCLSLTLDQYCSENPLKPLKIDISIKGSNSPRGTPKKNGSVTPTSNFLTDPFKDQIRKKSKDESMIKNTLRTEENSERVGGEINELTPFQKFYKQTKLIVQNSSSDESEMYLSTNSCFVIKNTEESYLSIKVEEKEIKFGSRSKGSKEGLSQYYNPKFHELNPIKKVDRPMEITESTEDFFFFSGVGYDEVSEIIMATSMLYPIIQLVEGQIFQGNDIIQDKMTKARRSMDKLIEWLTDNNLTLKDSSNMKKVIKQKMLREIGLIDILITLLYRFFSNGLLNSEHSALSQYKTTIKTAIELLQNILDKNKPNSLYSFQWDMFFMQMLLAEQLPRDLGLDYLLTTIFSDNQMNVTYLPKIVESLKHYEYYDNKALNIAISLCESIKSRPKADRDFINVLLLDNPKNTELIFRKWAKDSNDQICIQNSEKELILIESTLEYKNKKLFDYNIGLMKLATELSKDQSYATAKTLENFFSSEITVNLFQIENMNLLLKSAGLDLFTEMHFGNESRILNTLEFPNNIKFLGEIKKSESLKAVFDSRKHKITKTSTKEVIDFISFLKKYLEELHLWNNYDHKLNQSVMKSIMSLLKKGMYYKEEIKKKNEEEIEAEIKEENKEENKEEINEEILYLKYQLYDYLKHALTVINNDIPTQADADNDNPDEVNNTEGNDIINVLSSNSTESDTKNEEMIKWILEALKILIFMQKYENDCAIEKVFEKEKYAKYFNYEWLAKQEFLTTEAALNTITKIKNNKQRILLKFMHDYYKIQSYNYVQCLIELLLIGNLQLTCSIVNLLYESFSRCKNFLSLLNNVEVISKENIMIYTSLHEIYDELYQELLKIESNKGHELTESYQKINNTISQMILTFYQIKSPIRLPSPQQQQQPQQPESSCNMDNTYVIVFENYCIDIDILKEKQSLLKNMGFLDLIKKLFSELVNGYIPNNEEHKEFIKNFLLFFLFFVINDAENQTIFSKETELIKQILGVKLPTLQFLILKLVVEIFKDNYPLLINPHKSQNDIIELCIGRITENFQILYTQFKLNQELSPDIMNFLIQSFRILTIFFQIQNNFLTQNQLIVSSHFKRQILTNEINIDEILYVSLSNALNKYKIEQLIAYNKSDIVQVPVEISFGIYFFKTFGLMAKGSNSSNSGASLNNKHYLNLNQIQELIKNSEDWYNLKLAIIIFLNNTYIRNKKLEDNEEIELHNIIKDTLKMEICEYMRFLKKRGSYPRPPTASFESNIMSYFPLANEIVFENNIDTCYHQYILHGVLDSYNFYIERMKQQPSERDILIMDDYLSILKDLHGSLMGFKNNETTEKQPDKKNKKLKEVSEPPSLNLDDGSDMELADKDSFKKLNHVLLKNEISKYHMKILNLQEVKKMPFWEKENKISTKKLTAHSIKQQLNIDEEIIETEHNLELEMLIKFLLYTKINNVPKFKGIVTNFMSILSNDESSEESKSNALVILRRLSSFKQDQELFQSIQADLIDLKFISFLCKNIIETHDEDIRIQFIIGMIDFLDEASITIQEDFYSYLLQDEDNNFLTTLKNFMQTSFDDFREYEKNYNQQSDDIKALSKSIVFKKMNYVISGLQLIKFACEGQFSKMQNYFREQMQNGTKMKNSINFISFIGDLLNRYCKSVNENNAILGISILDTLMELLYGPCLENQLAICQTKILENIEDLIVEMNNSKSSVAISEKIRKLSSKNPKLNEVDSTGGKGNSQRGNKIRSSPQKQQQKSIEKANNQNSALNNQSQSIEKIIQSSEYLAWSRLNDRIIGLLQAMLEGTYDPNVTSKISQHIDVKIFIDKMQVIYTVYYKRYKKQPFSIKDYLNNHDEISVNLANPQNAKSNSNSWIPSSLTTIKTLNSEIFLTEGIYLMMILKLLADLSPDIAKRIKEYKEIKMGESIQNAMNFAASEKYYSNHIANIEIVNQKGNLERIYFPLVKKTKYLSLYSKKKFENIVNRESINEKLFGLLRSESIFSDEMDYFIGLRAKRIRFSLTSFNLIRDINLLIAIILNGFILFDPDVSKYECILYLQNNQRNTGDKIVLILGFAEIIISCLTLLLWLIFIAPLDFKTAIRNITSNNEKNESRSHNGLVKIKDNILFIYNLIEYIVIKTYFAYLSLYATFAILGLTVSKIFFSCLLLDIINSSAILRNVINSITLNHKQLIMTAVLGVLFIYIWGIIGYFAMQDIFISAFDDTMIICDNIWHCFLTVMEQGLRAGGGIGDVLELTKFDDPNNAYARKFFYDLLFFIFIIVILLNIIFGIIIDTFAELRDNKRFRDFDEKNKCFICNLDRSLFEKEGISFEYHTQHEHNLWNYLYYIIYLKIKDRMEYSGTETYIFNKYKNEDLSWFPIQRALSLINIANEDGEDLLRAMDMKLSTFENKIIQTIIQTLKEGQLLMP